MVIIGFWGFNPPLSSPIIRRWMQRMRRYILEQTANIYGNLFNDTILYNTCLFISQFSYPPYIGSHMVVAKIAVYTSLLTFLIFFIQYTPFLQLHYTSISLYSIPRYPYYPFLQLTNSEGFI